MRKYAFLTPWWRELMAYDLKLGGDRRSTYDDTITTRGVSVHVPPPGGWNGRKPIRDYCQTLRDALELVCLLSVVDRTAFVEMACGHSCGGMQPKQVERAFPDEEQQHDGNGTIRCRVELHGAYACWTPTKETHEWIRTAMDTMLTPQRVQDRTQSFQDARDKLVSVGSRHVQRLEISICVDAHKAIFPALSHLMRALAHSPGLAGNEGYPFQECVVDVQTDLDSGSLAQLDACLRDTARSRLYLGDVSIRTNKFTEQAAYGQQLSVLLRPSVERVPATAAPTTKSGASLEPATPDHPLLLRQLCSALMYCQGIDSLTVNWGPGDRRATPQARLQQMQWLAVALFSPWATHGIRHVHLRNFMLRGNECEDCASFCSFQTRSHRFLTCRLHSQMAKCWWPSTRSCGCKTSHPHDPVNLCD